jgi:hypothetical protein
MCSEVLDGGLQDVRTVECVGEHLVAPPAEDTAPALWARVASFAAGPVVVQVPALAAWVFVAADRAPTLGFRYLRLLFLGDAVLPH